MLAPALDFSKLGIFKVDRGILLQPAVARIVALNAHQNQLLAAFIHIVLHAPGGSIGGIVVKEHIVSVEQIHDGVAFFRFRIVAFRQINIGSANHIPGELRNGDIPFDDHEDTSFVPSKIWQFLPLT